MTTAPYSRWRRLADRQISRFGQPAILRRATTDPEAPGDRACTAMEVSLTSPQRAGQLRDGLDRIILVSAIGLTVAPYADKDRLVWNNPASGQAEELRIVAQSSQLAPANTVLYWELQVRR